jgi:hypothetical protein
VETTLLSRRTRFLLPAIATLWALAIIGGGAAVWNFESTPGVAATPPAIWPVTSRIPHAANRSTLVMLVHPRCPCSRASLEELDRIMARAGGRVSAHVVFAHAGEHSQATTDLERRAADIRGVDVVEDDGTEAIRFHAYTSGQTLLYGPDGRLLFNGGITVARGHEGDNGGRSAVEALLIGGPTSVRQTAVFGCSLLGSTRPGETKELHGL